MNGLNYANQDYKLKKISEIAQELGLDSESILPLIYNKLLKTMTYEYLPVETQMFLKESTYKLLATDLAHRRWLEISLEEFKLKDIPVILLKRSAFANNL